MKSYLKSELQTMSTEELLKVLTGLSNVSGLIKKANRDKVISLILANS